MEKFIIALIFGSIATMSGMIGDWLFALWIGQWPVLDYINVLICATISAWIAIKVEDAKWTF